MKLHFFHLFFLLCPVLLYAQAGVDRTNPALAIVQEDTRIEELGDGGFHLYIRKKPGISSVLITESTRDPALRAANYAYRAPAWNPINGDEIRLLDGNPIPRSAGIWSLISSTPKPHPELGEAFHIFIPYILNYGYAHARHGEVYVTAGTYLNIRAFTLPYADYRGSFRDNPFTLELLEQQPQTSLPEGSYMGETVEAYTEIASWSGNTPSFSTGPEDIVNHIKDILENVTNPMDIVICLDTTGSMRTNMIEVRQNLVPMLRETIGDSSYRIGMVLYKDYFEEYLTRVIPFTSDLNEIQRTLNGIAVRGGGDIPEAVHEALHDAATRFQWEAGTRLIILVGDAPPHLRQRGRISKEMVERAISDRNIKVHSIILPL